MGGTSKVPIPQSTRTYRGRGRVRACPLNKLREDNLFTSKYKKADTMAHTHEEAIELMNELYKDQDFQGLQSLHKDCLMEAQTEYHFNGNTLIEREWLRIAGCVEKRLSWIYQTELAWHHKEVLSCGEINSTDCAF